MERHDIDDQLSTTGAQELLASRRPPTSPTSPTSHRTEHHG
jgi:hypothetical protein